jgi:O-methyltransferase
MMDCSLDPAGRLYVDLLKRTVKNVPYLDVEQSSIMRRSRLRRVTLAALERVGIGLVHARRPSLADRLAGTDHTTIAHTMVSMARLDNVQSCVETVLRDEVPGDFIETGVLRGGTSIFMRGLLAVHGVDDRVVWLADSFEGLPPPDPERYPEDAGSRWHEFSGGAVSLAEVRDRFARYDLLDGQVEFLHGWFKDTLPNAPIGALAIIRLDGDMYESTMDALIPLYPKLPVGGFVIVDDWELAPCRRAVEDFRRASGITDPIVPIDDAAVYWRRSAAG